MGIISTIKRVVLKQARPIVFLKEWHSLFNSLSNSLNMLFGKSEEEFLSVGSKFESFSGRAKELSEMSSSATRLTSGKEIITAIEGLRNQFDRVTQYLESSQEESDCYITKLFNILEIIDNLDFICEGFKRMAQTLQFLSISARIETTRLGQDEDGFSTLADDVKKLAKLVDKKSIDILNNSKSLAIIIQDSISRSKELLNTQQSSAVETLKDARYSLESLIDLNEKSSRVSARLAKRSSEIYQNIGEVVSSMQFHDIARQQVEHVSEAMEDIQRRLKEARDDNGNISRDHQSELVCWVSDVCELQSSQLLCAKDEFVDAVNRIISNLKGISANVNTMVNELQEIDGSSHRSETSFLSRIEEGIIAVIKSLSENNKIGMEISTAVAGTVDAMAVFVNGIKEVGAEIELIALNARVKATRTGEEGKTLGVLAEAIQQLSMDARSQSTVLLDKLKTIAAEAGNFHARTDGTLDSSVSSVEDMMSIQENLLSSLRRINTDYTAIMKEINKNGRTLGEDIETITDKIMFHNEMARDIDNVKAGLDGIVKQIQQLIPSFTISRKVERFEVLKDRYTRRKEREIHQLAMVGIPGPTKKNINEPVINGVEGNLGDNVELF